LPALAFAQQTPGVTWKTPASWNVDVLAGRTFSTLTTSGPATRGRGWVAGATFGRYDHHRIGFNVQLLLGKQRPALYQMTFVEVPLLLRFDPFHRKNSGGFFSVFGGIGIGRRFHITRTFGSQTTTSRWAMYADAIVGANVDLRRVIVNIEYFSGVTKFAPASTPGHVKRVRSFVVNAGYELKRGSS
jgi:hypothetical protein